MCSSSCASLHFSLFKWNRYHVARRSHDNSLSFSCAHYTRTQIVSRLFLFFKDSFVIWRSAAAPDDLCNRRRVLLKIIRCHWTADARHLPRISSRWLQVSQFCTGIRKKSAKQYPGSLSMSRSLGEELWTFILRHAIFQHRQIVLRLF